MPDQPTLELDAAQDASRPFVSRWNGLVSSTNWEKGRIILEWRQALIDAGGSANEYSDEAWSRSVGTVSSQHVGRLRRVFEQFGAASDQYAGLYWSHFQSALEWPDPELWLEGAVQNGWTVSQMRRQRWQAYGAAEDEEPRDADIIAAEFNEDALPPEELPRDVNVAPFDSAAMLPSGPDLGDGPDFGEEDDLSQGSGPLAEDREHYVDESSLTAVRPFEDQPHLPADLSEALEIFKLAILRHKLSDWSEVPAEDVLATLDGLKLLVIAPSE